jgi:hypothetical protein
MQKIYGASDDLIEMDGPICDEIGCYNDTKKQIICSDGTRAQIDYGDEWKIRVITEGSLFEKLVPSVGDDDKHADPLSECTSYSDVLCLRDGLEWIRIGRKIFSPFLTLYDSL